MARIYIMYKRSGQDEDFSQISGWLSAIFSWRHLSGYRKRKVINHSLDFSLPSPQVVEYTISLPSSFGLRGKTLFFFSDLHYSDLIQSADLYSELLTKVNPDWIVFGGDLITYSCHLAGAFEWLAQVCANFADIPKVAVPGNWDRRRARWFPQHIWEKKYSECGFHYLVNHEIILNGIRFYGMDEVRGGKPIMRSNSASQCFNCIVSHSIEPVVDFFSTNSLPDNNLILCGHSHGGQVRIPLFGALLTSTKYWKLFEYGRYQTRKGDTDLILTSGVGYSRFPLRLFCPPEVVVIRFADASPNI